MRLETDAMRGPNTASVCGKLAIKKTGVLIRRHLQKVTNREELTILRISAKHTFNMLFLLPM